MNPSRRFHLFVATFVIFAVLGGAVPIPSPTTYAVQLPDVDFGSPMRAATSFVTLPVRVGIAGTKAALGFLGSLASAAQAEEPPSGEAPRTREEILSLRGETVKHFREPDGTYTAELSSGPVHFKDASGKWLEIDNTIIDSTDTSYRWRNRRGPIAGGGDSDH